MEIKSNGFLKMLAGCFICLLPLFSLAQNKAGQHAGEGAGQSKPVHVKVCTIKDGNMQIILSKNLSEATIDSFSRQYNLTDLKLYQFIKTNLFDSLKKHGWNLEVNNASFIVIAKPLESMKDMGSIAGKIVYTEKNPTISDQFPVESDDVIFGCNHFLNKNLFAVNKTSVTFFLKGYLKARRVMLAGSFNNWNPDNLSMQKTDSGWIFDVVISQPGKYWYKFIADGNWMIDNDNAVHEDDGRGNENSVYFLPNYTFKLDSLPNAKNVFLTGSFNHWKQSDLPMKKIGNEWKLPAYLAEGTHTYKFIVDGKWMTDPKNPNRLPDGNYGYNSVLSIGQPHLFKLNGYANARQVVLTGSFNGWRTDELYMKKTSGGWEFPYILRAGNYEYNFIVDGSRITDPNNPSTIGNDPTQKNSFLVIGEVFTFSLKGYGSAKTVYLSGDFNNWAEHSYLMQHNGDEWTFSMHLSLGKHKYKFIVDGKWITDPSNKLFEQNEYGTGNSVIWVQK